MEILSVRPWTGFQVVASQYRSGRAFLCGDAAHLFNPTGCFGMNTAITDAADLGWQLASVLAGWGGEALLNIYEVERRPVGVRNTVEVASNFDKIAALMHLPPELDQAGDKGEALRAEVGQKLHGQKKTWSASGMHLGYYYESSPIVIADGTPPPIDHPQFYTPTARPGSRGPHVWLEPGKSTLDLAPHTGFTLLRFGGAGALDELCDAAKARAIPYREAVVDSDKARALYAGRYVLLRPDGHVAWRSDAAPADPAAVVATISGH
ncbi:MAG: FAD-dependent monooxygenase [Candidatus Protistobacter heckmanni]|nr:FAD-dependent monooxygenase [Candidatus Protistobacter heckmanni]